MRPAREARRGDEPRRSRGTMRRALPSTGFDHRSVIRPPVGMRREVSAETSVAGSSSRATREEVAAEARIEEVAVVVQRELDRIVEGALRDVVSSRESTVVTAPHWPEDEDGSRDRPSAVRVCSSNSLRAVVEQITRLDGGRAALT